MKIKQEIIEARYEIIDLTKSEYDLIKKGLELFEYLDLIRQIRGNPQTSKANELLKDF